MHLRNIINAILSIVFLLVTTNAQQAPATHTDIALALEVVYLHGTPPAYLRLYSSKNGGAWYARFGLIAGWQLPPGELPIKAVRIVPYVEGDSVRINVSVLRGVKFQDAEDMVATYSAREGEQIVATPLEAYGVQPFELKVIRVAPGTSGLPLIVNETKSLEVIGVEPLVATFPRYKLTLRNLADKNIAALSVHIRRGEKTEISGMPHAMEGGPLIKAREEGELIESLATRAEPTPAGFTPTSPPSQQIVITSLVFEDGSYEGQAEPAAKYRAFVTGDRIELGRVVSLLDTFLATNDAASAAPEKLRAELEALRYDVDQADVDTVARAYPHVERDTVRVAAEVSAHGVRRDLLDRLQAFQAADSRSASDFQSWLSATRDRLANWLARIKSDNPSQP